MRLCPTFWWIGADCDGAYCYFDCLCLLHYNRFSGGIMPAQPNGNGSTSLNIYSLIYSDGWREYLHCSNDGIAVMYAQKTLKVDGLTDLVEVVRHTEGKEVRVWWNK